MWHKTGNWAIGGLQEIGFNSNSDLLMVLSSQGRGIFDCVKNEKIGRDYFDYYMENWDSDLGIVEGFGILKDEKIKCGGFEAPDILKKETKDGWKIKIEKAIRPNWKKEDVMSNVLYLTNKEINEKIEIYYFHSKIDRGYGYSETGNSFVIGTSSNLLIWNRKIILVDN